MTVSPTRKSRAGKRQRRWAPRARRTGRPTTRERTVDSRCALATISNGGCGYVLAFMSFGLMDRVDIGWCSDSITSLPRHEWTRDHSVAATTDSTFSGGTPPIPKAGPPPDFVEGSATASAEIAARVRGDVTGKVGTHHVRSSRRHPFTKESQGGGRPARLRTRGGHAAGHPSARFGRFRPTPTSWYLFRSGRPENSAVLANVRVWIRDGAWATMAVL